MNKAIAYIRVSTDAQRHGHGMDLQLQRIKDYASLRGYQITKVFRESHSGVGESSIADRPMLQDALVRSETLGHPIFVSRLDRLGRHEETVSALYANANIIDVENGVEADQALIAVKARDAERLGKLISKTTKKALKSKKALGLLGNKTNLREAQLAGAEGNRKRARARAEEYPSGHGLLSAFADESLQLSRIVNNLFHFAISDL